MSGHPFSEFFFSISNIQYPIWASPGATWGHLLSFFHLRHDNRAQPPLHHNLLSGTCREWWGPPESPLLQKESWKGSNSKLGTSDSGLYGCKRLCSFLTVVKLSVNASCGGKVSPEVKSSVPALTPQATCRSHYWVLAKFSNDHL